MLGVGLIGASLARSCKARGAVKRIVGFGRKADTLQKAEELNIIDSGSTDLKTAVEGSDLIVLCTPVGVLVERVREMIPFLPEGCILTDAGSVKGSLVREIDALMTDSIHYVGAHPIAGGEKSGLEASSEDLLTGAKCIITPTEHTRPEALQRITGFWKEVGMQTLVMDADEHDTIFGALSHLPHVVAYALMNTVAEVKTPNHKSILSLSGGGLRDITRIASSEPVMWRDICLKNKKEIIKLIDQYQQTLENIKLLIEQEQSDSLREAFANANGHREKLVESHL
ncbi:MAG: prephenate dehydrogenase/arogenate dehydrogenase family protein [Nitrospinaceae bacterium]|nr:prephenate dehydrogenase [Nitrospinaceae bacterium]NIR57154.1 prephenate dehydrogenase [Nitrospinaceae bacterium]NIS87596.1 prephenate dehydrogenase [Nitrospinaceae bacterium]NIT84467.1 prephenate dehydrogenase [Nitrospinaceae bacterium]NIU46653.1 prephenate dehydrogenase [Nitrospinaceae bacterium]